MTTLLGTAPTIVALVAPERLAVERGPFFCLGQPNCRDVPAPSALEKPRTHLHSLIEGRGHAIHDLLRDHLWTFDLESDPEEKRPIGGDAPRLEEWEQHGFVEGAVIRWFKN